MATKNELNTALSGVRLAAGSKVVGTSGGTSTQLFTREEINNMFGTSYPANGSGNIGMHVGIFVCNGDSTANAAHIDCVSYNPDTGVFSATFDRTVNTNIRINYLAVCF